MVENLEKVSCSQHDEFLIQAANIKVGHRSLLPNNLQRKT